MKKIIALSSLAFLSTLAFADADMQKQIDDLKAQLEKLEKNQDSQDKQISKVNAQSAKDNIKFDVDFRTSYDSLRYETVSGERYDNNSLYSNRLWLGMGYAPTDEMIFKGELAFNKAYGASYGQRSTGFGFDTFDWVLNENLTDDTIRVREAYWLWMPTIGGLQTTFSVGRRPSTNGYLINLRDDDKAKSPMGHVINMEFDGASASVKLDQIVQGMSLKLCLGRGLTNATGWASEATKAVGAPVGGSTQPNYTVDDSSLDNTDLVGVIFVPYNDGQYSVEATWYRGFDVPGLYASTLDDTTYAPTAYSMESGGNMDGGAISFKTDGVGNEISDFLDETILFASFAYTQSHPDSITRNLTDGTNITGTITSESMLGSADSEIGTSYWIGAQMPNLTGGKFGLEYNHGSKYWRPFTYGEDTMIGSKIAVRGSAYEAYWTQPLVKDVFSMQVRYTYLDYDYSGSNGFFGDGGTPIDLDDTATLTAMGMDPVKTASDLRVYFRYRY
jgi:hypothetical protein